MLNIKNPEADRLARALAQQMGETITEVVIEALREKLLREQGKKAPPELAEALLAIGHRCATLPDQDTRSPRKSWGMTQMVYPVRRKHDSRHLCHISYLI